MRNSLDLFNSAFDRMVRSGFIDKNDDLKTVLKIIFLDGYLNALFNLNEHGYREVTMREFETHIIETMDILKSIDSCKCSNCKGGK